MKTRKGFTLVELLVVISIIAALLAILIPSLSKAKESARSTVCRSHIGQLTLAASLWSNDHDGYVVAGMWDVPAKIPGDDTSSGAALTREAIRRGASLEKYTASSDIKKNSLYSCPTAVKFGNNFFFLTSSPYTSIGASRIATTSYGVNAYAVMYTYDGYLGDKGSDGAIYAWGPDNTYMLEHGKSRLLHIPLPSTKVYFSDFSYPIIYAGDLWRMYNPLRVCFKPASGEAYAYAESLATLPPGAKVVQARWHGTVDEDTGYGYGNIGWFDGSVSREPPGFDDPDPITSGGFGGTRRYNWQQYFYNIIMVP